MGLGFLFQARAALQATPVREAFNEMGTRGVQTIEAVASNIAASMPPETVEWIPSLVATVTERVVTAVEQDARERFASMTPNEVIDDIIAESPEFAEVGALIKTDPTLAGAIQSALVDDPSMLRGITTLIDGEGGPELLDRLNDILESPEARGTLATVLQNVAESDTINFTQFNNIVTSFSQFDMENMEASNQRVLSALEGAGFTAEEAQTALGNMHAAAAQEQMQGFIHALFNNPQAAAGMLGNMLSSLGLPEGMVNVITGFVSNIFEGMQGMPDLLDAMWNGENGMFRDLNDITRDIGGILTPDGVEARQAALATPGV